MSETYLKECSADSPGNGVKSRILRFAGCPGSQRSRRMISYRLDTCSYMRQKNFANGFVFFPRPCDRSRSTGPHQGYLDPKLVVEGHLGEPIWSRKSYPDLDSLDSHQWWLPSWMKWNKVSLCPLKVPDVSRHVAKAWRKRQAGHITKTAYVQGSWYLKLPRTISILLGDGRFQTFLRYSENIHCRTISDSACFYFSEVHRW